MTNGKEINIPEILKDRPRVQKALRDSVQDAIRIHKLMGVPIVVWRDGKVVEIPPDEIVLDDDTHANGNGSIKSH
jgi:hypothetical protein